MPSIPSITEACHQAAFALALAEKMPTLSMEWSDELCEAWMTCAAAIIHETRAPAQTMPDTSTEEDRAWAISTAKTLFGEDGTEDGNDLAGVAMRAMERAEKAEAERDEARKALEPFAHYYDLNDLDERGDDDALEIPVRDLRRARQALTGTAPLGKDGEK